MTKRSFSNSHKNLQEASNLFQWVANLKKSIVMKRIKKIGYKILHEILWMNRTNK